MRKNGGNTADSALYPGTCGQEPAPDKKRAVVEIVSHATVYRVRSLSSCCFPAFQPETSCRYPVTRLICTTSCEPHSGHTGSPQGQYSIGEHLVGKMTVVQGAHDGQAPLTAPGAGRLVDHQVTGITLITALVYRNILKPLLAANHILLFLAPLHAIQ